MKVILLILFLVSLLYLLLVNVSWSTRENLMHYRAGRLTRTGRISHFLMELRQLKRHTKTTSAFQGYEEIVLFFDKDEPGKLATEAVAALLPSGKVKIAHLPDPYKDRF